MPIAQRVARMLDAYERQAIDAGELHRRLLLAAAGHQTDTALRALLGAVDEATDLGRPEREDIAWAAARYWRSTCDIA